jgi:signal peptidase I
LALVIIRFYVFQPFTISGTSMEPSFFHGEYLIVEEFSYNFSEPKRGDVVVFRHPEPDCDDHINSNYINRKFFQGACSNYIKRVVGLPGETVTIREGKVAVDGEALEETYIPKNIPTLGNQTVVLAEDEFFVLGDNRNPNASSDSREWGALPKTHIVGRALVILLPPQKFGVVERIEF